MVEEVKNEVPARAPRFLEVSHHSFSPSTQRKYSFHLRIIAIHCVAIHTQIPVELHCISLRTTARCAKRKVNHLISTTVFSGNKDPLREWSSRPPEPSGAGVAGCPQADSKYESRRDANQRRS